MIFTGDASLAGCLHDGGYGFGCGDEYGCNMRHTLPVSRGYGYDILLVRDDGWCGGPKPRRDAIRNIVLIGGVPNAQ